MADSGGGGGTGANTLMTLQQELSKARERLHGFDEDIRKLGFEGRQGGPGGRGGAARHGGRGGRLTGANSLPARNNEGNQRRSSATIHNQNRLGSAVSVPAPSRRALQQRNDASCAKRIKHENENTDRTEGDDVEEDDMSDDGNGHGGDGGGGKLQSSIVVSRGAAVDLNKTREEEIAKQQRDGEAQARHRRLFGVMLMGTLRKFKNEMESQNEVEKKRTEISQRLEEKERVEKEERDAKSRALMTERQAELRKVRQMEAKIRILSEFDDWAKSTSSLGYHIRTSHNPPIYWIPAKPSEKTDALLARTRAIIDSEIAAKRREVEEDTDFFPKAIPDAKPEQRVESEGRRRGASRFLLPEDLESADLPEDEDEGDELVPAPGGTILGPAAASSSLSRNNGNGASADLDEEDEDISPETANGSIVQAPDSQESMTSASATPLESTLAAGSNSNLPAATPVTLMEQDSQQPKLPTPPVWTDENAQMGQFTPIAINDTINSSATNGGGNTDMDVDDEDQLNNKPSVTTETEYDDNKGLASSKDGGKSEHAELRKQTSDNNNNSSKTSSRRGDADERQQGRGGGRQQLSSRRDDDRTRERDSGRSGRGSEDRRNERPRSRERGDNRRRENAAAAAAAPPPRRGYRSRSKSKSRSRSRSRQRQASSRYMPTSQRERQAPPRGRDRPNERPSARASPPSRPADRGRPPARDVDPRRKRSSSSDSSSSSGSSSSSSSSSSSTSSSSSSSSSTSS